MKRKHRWGRVLIADSMLWGGKVLLPSDRTGDTQGVRKFTAAITGDPDGIVTFLPIRDGLIVAYRVSA